MCRLLQFLILLGLIFTHSLLFAQEPVKSQPNSPVFKNYRPPPVLPRIEQSSVLFEIWQSFITARKANAGDVIAQHELGLRYLTGRGVEADTVKAAYWIQQAAAKNNVSARFNLAILAYHGWGIPWDPFEAFQQFLYCANYGMVEAQYVLGQFYSENLVVPRDWTKAYEWVKKAADGGFAPAREILPELAKNLPEAGDATKKAGTDSAATKPPQSDAGMGLMAIESSQPVDSSSKGGQKLKDVLRSLTPELRSALGLTAMIDSEVSVDSARINTISRAAEAGSPEALTLLGRCYEKGIGVAKDPVIACSYYIRAVRTDALRAPQLLWDLLKSKSVLRALKTRATEGDSLAEFAWAGILALGYDGVLAEGGTYLTAGEALRLLQKSAEKKTAPAIIELGLCYYAGRWVKHDQAKALALWEEAARLGSKEASVRMAMVRTTTSDSAHIRMADIATLQRAAEEGSVLAEVGLGYCREHGIGVPSSRPEAARLYRAGAMRGSQDGYRALRRMYDEIRPGEKEYVMDNLP